MNIAMIGALFVVSVGILGFFVMSWVVEFLRKRDYVNRIVHDQHRNLSNDEKRNIGIIIRRLLGLNKSVVELAIEKQKLQQSVELNKRINPSLAEKLQRSGLNISVLSFYIFSAILFMIAFLVGRFYSINMVMVLPVCFLIAFALPRFLVTIVYKRRLKKFTHEFPNAIDVLVRGLRSGLPLVDCLRIISQETQEPVRSEFKKVTNDQSLGMPATEAILKLAERIPTTEVNFLAIVVKVQGRTGGSLTEALGNLSVTLRERRKLQDKIKAMSQEAKSSAAIIGLMPVFVALGLYTFSPEYLSVFFTETAGRIVLALSGFWMLLGILIMRKMINFEV